MKRTIFFIMVLVALIMLMALISSFAVHADDHRSFWDRDGHFGGSASTYNGGRNETFTDRNGHFGGSAIHNSDGSTSYYDRNGHFTGSSGR